MNYTSQLKSFHFYVQHHEVPVSAQIVYLHLLHRDNELMWQEWFKFSIRHLVLFTGLGSPNTVRNGIAFLQKAGLIECMKKNRATTQFKIMPSENFKSVSNVIQIEPEPEETNCIKCDTDTPTVSDMIQTDKENCINNDTDEKTVSPTVSTSVSPTVSDMIQFSDSYNNINNNININNEREDLCNQDSSSLKEAVDIFQNSFRPLKNIYESEQIQAMVTEYGLPAFKSAIQIAKEKRPRVPLPYLESVLRNNKGSPREKPAGNLKNDAKAGMQRALEILEGDDD